MTDAIDEQIEARKKQAKDKRIYGKAMSIHEELGDVFNNAADRLVIKYKEIPASNPMSMFPDHVELTITYGGKTVFDASYSVNVDIKAYTPGKWEKKLEELYELAHEISTKSDEIDHQESLAIQAAEAKAKRDKEQMIAGIKAKSGTQPMQADDADPDARSKWGLDETADDATPPPSAPARPKTGRDAIAESQKALKKISSSMKHKFA